MRKSSENVIGAAAKATRGTVDGVEGYITTVELFIPNKAFGGVAQQDKLPFYLKSFLFERNRSNDASSAYDGKLAFGDLFKRDFADSCLFAEPVGAFSLCNTDYPRLEALLRSEL